MKKLLSFLALSLLAGGLQAAANPTPSVYEDKGKWVRIAGGSVDTPTPAATQTPVPTATAITPLQTLVAVQTQQAQASLQLTMVAQLNSLATPIARLSTGIYVSPVAATLPVSSTGQAALTTYSVTTLNLSATTLVTDKPIDMIFGALGASAGLIWKRRGCTESVMALNGGWYLAASNTVMLDNNAPGTCFDFNSTGVIGTQMPYSMGKQGQ